MAMLRKRSKIIHLSHKKIVHSEKAIDKWRIKIAKRREDEFRKIEIFEER